MDDKDSSQRIYITKTPREWKAIEKRMQDIGRKDLAAYVSGRISLLEKQYSNNPKGVVTSIPKREQKSIFIKESSLRVIEVMSLKTGIPIATLIDRLIIEPLIFPAD